MTIILVVVFRIVVVTATKRYSGKYVFLTTNKKNPTGL